MSWWRFELRTTLSEVRFLKMLHFFASQSRVHVLYISTLPLDPGASFVERNELGACYKKWFVTQSVPVRSFLFTVLNCLSKCQWQATNDGRFDKRMTKCCRAISALINVFMWWTIHSCNIPKSHLMLSKPFIASRFACHTLLSPTVEHVWSACSTKGYSRGDLSD